MAHKHILLAVAILIATTSTYGQTLHGAAFKNDVARVRTLVEQGSDVNAKDSQGVTPLHYAAQMGHIEIMEILISRGADVNVSTSKDGAAPIHLASANGQLEAVRLLTKHGANVNKANNYRATPLHFAADHGYAAIVSLLIDHGASVNAKASNGRTAMKAALAKGYPDVMEVLRIGGAVLEKESELIQYVENQLWLRAYGVTSMDGTIDPDTRAAVKAYQQDAGLKPDGRVTRALADHLTSTGQYKLVISRNTKIATNVFISYSRLAEAYKWNQQGKPIRVTGGAAYYTPGSDNLVTCEVPPRFPSEAMCWDAKDHRFGNLRINGRIVVLRSGIVFMKGSVVSIDPQ